MMYELSSGAAQLGIVLTPAQLELFDVYFQELIAWNRRLNLTSITSRRDVQIKHFLDSLTVVLALQRHGKPLALKVIDIGTGAGLPGLPLKIAWPEIRLTLLEATLKKTGFLHHLVSALGFKDVEIVSRRAEELARDPGFRERFDIVLARAVATLPALAEIALPFCAAGGLFITHKKGDIGPELEQSQKAISLMGGRLKKVIPVNLAELPDGRCLLVVEKIAPTPPRYPRRPGIPEKRPVLGPLPG